MIKKKEWLAQNSKFDELKEADWDRENLERPLIRGLTPLMWACRTGNKEMVVWLVQEKGVNVQGKDASEWTAIMHAIGNEQVEIVDWILKREIFDEKTYKKWEKVMSFHEVEGQVKILLEDWKRAHWEKSELESLLSQIQEEEKEEGKGSDDGDRGEKVKRL